ncbi:hypothetical protein IVB02_34395 [Bradyrhizobium sp. 166]|uniref:hypothetical protein n=1 Tax=Bradyrhizobium sp. 166 TaxID=2782638 RepID=UPI001FFB607B|nr:hypothetical protein [Bradyrhizobium sp. 166]
MPGSNRSWRTELIGTYPDLFHPPADNPGVAQAYPECGEGWCDLLDRLCVRIRAAVQADGGTFKFTQVKEKFATIRIYWDGRLSPDAAALVEEAIALAEARSACTCEECGELGRLYQSGNWLMTRCAAHAKGLPVDTRPEMENIHIVRRLAAGQVQLLSCRRYDRQSDAFTDVDPTSLGIEED